MVTAKDVMTIDVFAVSKDTNLDEAIEVMLRSQVSGLPVVDDDMALVGIITEKDVLKLYENPPEATTLTVEDFMTTPAVFFDKDDTLESICRCLIQRDFRRVPVTSDGKVVGIVSRPDIAKRILKLARGQIASDGG
ncbi:MAG: CBS domain-containing protein [Planctomycetota bacterium]|jgi:CBS domain-containing protein